MRRQLLAAVMLLSMSVAVSARAAVGPNLPVQADGFLLAPVSDALAARIAGAQDGKGVSFTIAIDGAAAEPLAVSPDRLKDYQNVYYRVTGQPGSWLLEERGFSPTGENDESMLIRRALGVPADKKFFFLPGREHLLVPAKTRVVLRAGGEEWNFRVPGPGGATRAVLVRAGQPIRLALAEALSTATARAGAAVGLSVVADVKAEGLTVISKGARIEARLAKVSRPGAMGAPGYLALDLGAAKAVDGTEVLLLAAAGQRVAFEGCCGFLVFRAAHLVLPAGTIIEAHAGRTVAVLAPAE